MNQKTLDKTFGAILHRAKPKKPKSISSWREGQRAIFVPNPASLGLYSNPPPIGATGSVTTVPLGGGRRSTYMKGPGGGLVYVKWDGHGTMGVSSFDLDVLR